MLGSILLYFKYRRIEKNNRENLERMYPSDERAVKWVQENPDRKPCYFDDIELPFPKNTHDLDEIEFNGNARYASLIRRTGAYNQDGQAKMDALDKKVTSFRPF